MSEDPIRRSECSQEWQDRANADHLGKRGYHSKEHQQDELKPPAP